MCRPRKIDTRPSWLDPDGIKIYTISVHGRKVDQEPYLAELAKVKKRKPVAWAAAPAFAIFHEGRTVAYLILAWWGNGNELFTSVSARTTSGWVEDPTKYSFCVHDLEVIWQERNYFVEFIDCAMPSLETYRAKRPGQR